MSRYLRQTVLPQIGADGQERIATAHVLVVGAGGLGVPVLQYLAGAGIGAITLIGQGANFGRAASAADTERLLADRGLLRAPAAPPAGPDTGEQEPLRKTA